ncbi:hypothetical protein [Candidatus Neptunochlamydia vexilliferae]|uniref:hypothetical protein n=1 Tax=Candidatus Neptunichlamydia vexilliferae TaxID=1651774 RepID=UPI001891514C|nr:hypothetical protein [Candidatus Neptunochlamydia vexilliferae]
MNPIQLDQAYNEFISNLSSWIPEGIIEVDMALLEETGLLIHASFEEETNQEELPHYFHVIETNDKVTLFNHQFAIWIVPKIVDENPTTIVMISLLTNGTPHLELVFSTKGVYNTPKFVLKLLKYYLSEVIDTEEAISSIGKGQA